MNCTNETLSFFVQSCRSSNIHVFFGRLRENTECSCAVEEE